MKFAKERQRRKIKSRATINEIARGELQTLKKNLYSLKLKYIQQTMPAAINIFKDRIIIFPEEKDEIILFVIDNKEIAESFRVQFELLWNQDVSTYHGHNAVESIYDSIIENTNIRIITCFLHPFFIEPQILFFYFPFLYQIFLAQF